MNRVESKCYYYRTCIEVVRHKGGTRMHCGSIGRNTSDKVVMLLLLLLLPAKDGLFFGVDLHKGDVSRGQLLRHRLIDTLRRQYSKWNHKA